MSAQEIRRGSDRGSFRLGQGQSRQHLLPKVRYTGGKMGPGRVPPNGGIGEIGEVMPSVTARFSLFCF